MWQMVNHRGRCYNLLLSKVADVIAIMLCVADGKPTKLHVTMFVNLLADVMVKVVDGIATKGLTSWSLLRHGCSPLVTGMKPGPSLQTPGCHSGWAPWRALTTMSGCQAALHALDPLRTIIAGGLRQQGCWELSSPSAPARKPSR